MKIKNLVSIIAAIGLAVAGSVFANADNRHISLDENGRVIREYNTAETHPALRSGTEAIVTQLPIVPIGDTAEDENTAELMADSDLVAHEIEKCTILLSEDTAQLIVRLNEFYDAKYKLCAELVDRNDNVVATQTGCEYDFESRWNCQLIYDLEYIPGFELNVSENYFVKFTYSGDFNFVNETGRVGFMVNDDPYLRSGEMIDADAGNFKLHVANFNPDYTYYVGIDGVRYEPTDISDGYLYVTAENLDNYPYDYIPVSLYAHNGSFERYCGEIEIPFIVYGSDAYDEHYNGLYIEKAIGLDTRALFFDIYNKENGAVYTAQEAANIKIHMLDTVTGANVGNATVQHYPSDNFVEAKINITTTPVNNRAYLVIVDDGYTIRTVTIYATNSPGFRFCAVDDGYGSYSSYDIPDRQNYTGMIFDSYNISDISKLDISITDYDGNTVVALDKGSLRYRNNVTWANNVINFTMTRKIRVDYDSEYLFTVNYNGETISVNECYFYPLYGSSSSYYIDGYITDSFATETNTYIVFGRRVEGFNEASLKYALYSRANGQKYFGTVERVICDDGWYKYLVLKFNHVLPDGNYGEWELLVCDESGGIVYREDGYDIHTDTLPYIYSYTYTDESGIVHLFCEGRSGRTWP